LLTGRGITLGSISVGSRADFEAMNRAIALHRLHPVIDRTFPFAEAKEAYRYFEGRGHFAGGSHRVVPEVAVKSMDAHTLHAASGPIPPGIAAPGNGKHHPRVAQDLWLGCRTGQQRPVSCARS
jgi:hypothetical protein